MMIAHQIGIKPSTYNYNQGAFPVKTITQEELDELVKNCKLQIGDIVAYKSVADQVINAGACDVVTHIITDVKKIEYEWSTNAPKFLRLMSCYILTALKENEVPFNRLAADKDIVKLGDEAYERVIRPIHDQLQDRIAKLKEHYSK